MTIKILDDIDIAPILEEYHRIENKIEWLEDGKTKQSSLQHLKDFPSFIEGCGRIKIEETKFGIRYKNKETDFDVCHEIISGTVFEDIIKKYKLKRSRLMWVKSKSCYSLHADFSPRIHIPLITNLSAMFVFRDTGIQHLLAGKVYWIDTRKMHSFANFGDTDRLHLIGCV